MIGGAINLDGDTFFLGRPQSFAFSSAIIRDDLVGRRENSLSRAVVLFQADDGAIGKILFKIQDIADRRPAKSVDRLVVIPYYAKVLMTGRQKMDQLILHLVRVLVLINQDVQKTFAVVLEHLRVLAKQLQGFRQDVIKVHRVLFHKRFLIRAVNLGPLLSVSTCRSRFVYVFRAHIIVFKMADAPQSVSRRHQPLTDAQYF